MSSEFKQHPRAEELWRIYMTTGTVVAFALPKWYEAKFLRPFVKLLPKDPRCKICYYPFGGVGGTLARMFLRVEASRLNPGLCNICEQVAMDYPGGAEIELTMLFADVRGSTPLAERMSPAEFSRLIDRFYSAATKALFRKNGMVEKLIGDAVTGFFVPGIAGPEHARMAVEAGDAILEATGHRDPAGPWIPVGVGVHTGIAFVGSVTAEGGVANVAILGDNVNAAARLASVAGVGELIVSEAARQAAGLDSGEMEARHLDLRGRTEPLDVWVRGLAPY
jgi:adenylate cyclase